MTYRSRCPRQKKKKKLAGRKGIRTLDWGVLIYKSVSDLYVTIRQPRDLNFRGRNTFKGSNFFVIRFARHKNCPFNFLVFCKETKNKTKEIKGTVFGVCKTNEKEI